jgi:hypothetical protein
LNSEKMKMETIYELLKSYDENNPLAWVQGSHTRISMSDEWNYIVIRREHIHSSSSPYTVVLYEGQTEEIAVKHFIESENGGQWYRIKSH